MEREDEEIFLYHPGKSFPAVSVTGEACRLQCDHCRGHYLKGMKPVSNEQELIELAKALEKEGAEGILVSGGCDENGKIPLGPFLPALKRIKQETKLRINLHTGLVDHDEASRIASTGVDCVSFDLIMDPDVIHRRLHLSCGSEAQSKTMTSLFSAGMKQVVPHLLVGLAGDDHAAEIAAIETASKYPVAGFVVLGLMPTKGTPMENSLPPSDDHLLEMLERAIDAIDAPVMLGCMRPRGRWQLEIKAIERGVRRIAMPSPRTEAWAIAQGYRVTKRSSCCVF